MRIAGLLAALAIAGCGQEGGAKADADAGAAQANTAAMPAPAATAAPSAAPAAAAGCADGPPVAIDAASFAMPDGAPTPAALERLRGEAERAVRAAAAGLCAERRLPADAFRGVRRLLVQQADGADNAAFWSGEGTPAPGDLVFQAVFRSGGAASALAVPDETDLREGLICWHDFEGNRAMCEERLP